MLANTGFSARPDQLVQAGSQMNFWQSQPEEAMPLPEAKTAKRAPPEDNNRQGSTTPGDHVSETEHSRDEFSLGTNGDVMALLAEFLSNQHAFFAGVSKQWRNAWGRLPKTTKAITADTSVSQLQWCFDGGLRKRPMLCEHIAEHCGVEILRFAYFDECEVPLKACFNAVARGRLEMIQWALGALGQYSGWRESLCMAAAAGGSLRILKWARANGCPWDHFTCSEAAGSGNLDILHWARENNCPWGTGTCTKAAEGGHLDILQWARAHGCRLFNHTCSAAAGSGHLDILQWARSENCPWDTHTCSHAAEGGHLGVLRWARAHGASGTR
eukprot:jgi/Undpi1/4303/HiC_scaffold_17.g07669.m1